MGFASAAPAEYDAYLPDSEDFRRNTRSDGPYRIAQLRAGGPRDRARAQPGVEPESDPIRHQYVDAIRLLGTAVPYEVVRRRIEAGKIDPAWLFAVVSWAKPGRPRRGAAELPGFALEPLPRLQHPQPQRQRGDGRFRVRQAIASAVDKVAISRIFDVLEGVTSAPLHSVIPPGSVGHREFDPYPTPGGRGDPARARRLLEDTGHGGGLRLVAAVRDAHSTSTSYAPSPATSPASVWSCLHTYSQADYYGTLLPDLSKAAGRSLDIAEPGWTPDWFGNNGRAVVQPLFQTNPNPGTTNYGGYSSPEVDALIERAWRADAARADELRHRVDARVMRDLPVLPLLAFACRYSMPGPGPPGGGRSHRRRIVGSGPRIDRAEDSVHRKEGPLGIATRMPESPSTVRHTTSATGGPAPPLRRDAPLLRARRARPPRYRQRHSATSGQILRALTRQLFAYPASGDLSDPPPRVTPAPDVAAEVPTVANGGLSPHRTVYTIRLRPGVRWDSDPPRPVTAADFVRGLNSPPQPHRRLRRPALLTSTILGMREFCDDYDLAFRGAAPAAADLARFQAEHDIAGAPALDHRTLELTLRRPANDFLNILAMGFASAAPVEYDAYLPDSEEFRRNTRSDGPYRIAQYEPGGREIVLVHRRGARSPTPSDISTLTPSTSASARSRPTSCCG